MRWTRHEGIKLAPCFIELNQQQPPRAQLCILLPQSCLCPCISDLYLSTPTTLHWRTAPIHRLPRVHPVSDTITLSLNISSFPLQLQYAQRNPQKCQPFIIVTAISSILHCTLMNLYNIVEHGKDTLSLCLSLSYCCCEGEPWVVCTAAFHLNWRLTFCFMSSEIFGLTSLSNLNK